MSRMFICQSKKKENNETSNVRATKAGERLLIDISGPYPRSMGGSKYWFKVVDDYSQKD